MKHKDLVMSRKLISNQEEIIDLEMIYPLGKIECSDLKQISYRVDGEWIELDNLDSFQNKTARFIKVLADSDCTLSLYLGLGYIASKDDNFTNLFNRRGPWAGGDGIFSFNLTNGNDAFDQDKVEDTLFVFGDTLIGKIDPNSNKRLYPINMPSNTIAYLNGKEPVEENIQFQFNKDEFDTILPYYKPQNDSQYEGTIPHHLCKYTTDKQLTPWLSGYSPEKVEITFDLYDAYQIDHIDFYNYFLASQIGFGLEKRGVKTFHILASHDNKQYTDLGQYELTEATSLNDFTNVEINAKYRYFKMVITPIQGIGNHYQKEDTEEVVFGLNKVKFYSEDRLLTDVAVSATSIMNKSKANTWFWLQDGVVIDNHLFFLPILITTDLTKIEGMQFAVKGTSLVKTPIINGRVDFSKQVQKDTSLCVDKNNTQWLFGCAIMSNTAQAGAINPDGYIYVYGYSNSNMGCSLHVSRVKPEDFEHISKWQFYTATGWGYESTESLSLVEHVSCEMSVSPITSGENKGKYLAVFEYDVNSNYVAYSIGESPVGPFTEPRKVYYCPDQDILKGTSYTYNAKAHPHLSSSQNILVSYNVNTHSMEHNESNCEVYRPRFIRLKDTSRD